MLLNFNTAEPKAHVETETGQVQTSIGMGKLNLPLLLDDLPRTGHVMPSLKHT